MALRVGVARPTQRITVAKPRKQKKLKVVYNYGSQTANHANVQGGSSSVVQRTSSRPVQSGNTARIQGGRASVIQSQATARQVQQAVEQQRKALAREQARQKELLRKKVQAKVDKQVIATTSKLKVRAQKSQFRIKQGSATKFNIKLPEQTEYQKYYAEAYNQAMSEINAMTDGGNKKGLSKVWDDFIGRDSRDKKAREYAEKRAEEISRQKVLEYQQMLGSVPFKNGFLGEQSKKIAKLQKTKFGSQSEYDKAIKDYTEWEKQQISALEKQRGFISASLDAYGKSSQKPLESGVSKATSWIADKATSLDQNPLFRQTIGSGSESLPSFTTAIPRLVNFIGNINTKDRDIYQTGGTSFKRSNLNKNAWQSTFNQRNFNKRPWIDVTPATAPKQLKDSVQALIQTRKELGETDPEKLDYDKVLREWTQSYNRRNRNLDSVFELSADPTILAGATIAGAKKLGWIDKAAKAGRSSRGTSWMFRASDSIKNTTSLIKARAGENKAIKWLGSEHKTHPDRVGDFVLEELDDIAIKKPEVRRYINEWQRNKGLIKSGEKSKRLEEVIKDFDFSDIYESNNPVTRKFEKERLSKSFQQFYRNGWGGVTDIDRLSPEQVKRIESLAKRYKTRLDKFYELEQKAGVPTPFRKDYLPQYPGRFGLAINKVKKKFNDEDWWFTKEQKKQVIQSDKQFKKSLVARAYGSQASRKDLPVLREIVAGTEDLGRNIDRIRDARKTVRKTGWEKAMRPASIPHKVWKKFVLLGNPAWYANNEVFNQMQGISAGGFKFLRNQRKTKKYYQHLKQNFEARELPSKANKMLNEISSDISSEVGTSKLARFASKQEGRARIALYRTYKQQGLDHDTAIKKVNNRLFNYKTKNWERPLKAVDPFWMWHKNITKAAVKLPFTAPKTAVAYSRLDRYQQQQFDSDFNQIVPQLKELGYSDEEIQKFKDENAKYFKGRLKLPESIPKVGGNYITTPFNAFSEKGLNSFGISPYISALGESGSAKDFYGQPLSGYNASLRKRLLTKFPALKLGANWLDEKPNEKNYIGEPGSEGYGLTKQAQGGDPTKANYVRSMDKRAKLGQDTLAFFGIPRGLRFDKDDLVTRKRLQKATDTYFGTDWDKIEEKHGYDERARQQEALFKRYGLTADEFYKRLGRYDSDHTIAVKKLKEEARHKNTALFDEYGKQPKGTRNQWAVNKLRELNQSGYFGENPFLKSFDWIDPSSVSRAEKQTDVQRALATGDWSEYRKKYKVPQSQKSKDYQTAKASGDWTAYQKKYGVKGEKVKAYRSAKASGDWTSYREKYGIKESPYQHEGKFFKTAESMQRYKEGSFWKQYAKADRDTRKELLAQNPEYNTRGDWTREQWDQWRTTKKAKQLKKAMGNKEFAKLFTHFKSANTLQSEMWLTRQSTRGKRYNFQLS